eukprot:5136756-Amphidinium_carterae.1
MVMVVWDHPLQVFCHSRRSFASEFRLEYEQHVAERASQGGCDQELGISGGASTQFRTIGRVQNEEQRIFDKF